VIEQVRSYIRAYSLLKAGDRVAVAVSGGADSVALLRVLLELQESLGAVLSVAHFHHGIRGAEADADLQFVNELAGRFDLELHTGAGDAPTFARQHKASLETAARELRHRWFAKLLLEGKADKIATAHTLDDQAETVMMRVIRGTGARGLAGIFPLQAEKQLVRPLLQVSRREVEAYLRTIGQPWREDSSNRDSSHTRNRVRHQLIPLLERDFNPSIRQTLAGFAEVARSEAEYWNHEVLSLLPRLVRPGKPSRSGRSTSGEASDVLALDLAVFKTLPLALQRQALHELARKFGVSLELKHVQQLTEMAREGRGAGRLALPDGLVAVRTFRELQLSRAAGVAPAGGYSYLLTVPGEVMVPELGSIMRTEIIGAEACGNPGCNRELLLDRARLASQLTVRNWREGDRFFPAHTRAPKKLKELLQPDRLGRKLSSAERKTWPIVESVGQIVWVRGFAVPEEFASRIGDAVLIQEIGVDRRADQ
jgi:tRNA(Ile)-lysidine synthase